MHAVALLCGRAPAPVFSWTDLKTCKGQRQLMSDRCAQPRSVQLGREGETPASPEGTGWGGGR